MLITLAKLIKVNPKLQVVLNEENIGKLKIELLRKFGTITAVAKKSRLLRKFVSDVLRSKFNPNILSAQELVKLAGLKMEDVVDKITLRSRSNGSFISIKDLPIKPSPELASLVGRACGDGNIGTCFGFTNKTQETLGDVINKVNSLPIQNLTMNKAVKDGVTNLRFSSLVKDILIVADAPQGNKIKKEFRVPNWIMSGSKKIKIEFLRALFDDEGTVSRREISMNLSKNIKLKENLINFLLDIKFLLNSLKVDGVTIQKNKRMFEGKNGVTIRKNLCISRFFNIKRFNDSISFVNRRKAEKLKDVIKNTQVIRMTKEQQKQLLIKLFKNEEFLRRIDIARGLKITKTSVSQFMKKFEEDKLVTKIKLVPGNKNFRVLFTLNANKLQFA